MDYLEWKEYNVHYVLIDNDGDEIAEVSLPNIFTLDGREAMMGTLAAATRSKWSEATEYNFEG
jgi:hypothetical protein